MKKKGKNKLFVSLLLVLSLLSGCASKDPVEPAETGNSSNCNVETTGIAQTVPGSSIADKEAAGELTPEELQEALNQMDLFLSSEKEDKSQTGETTKPAESDETGQAGEEQGELLFENATYVLIYNPLIYDQRNSSLNRKTTLSSGYFGTQIVTGASRGEGLGGEESEEVIWLSQLELEDTIPPEVLQEDDRTSVIEPVYKKGDKHNFYCDINDYRSLKTFRCEYAGEHCYIWVYNSSISKKDAIAYGTAFDEEIYDKDVDYFGKARFTENGGKINLLFYPISNSSIMGFFTSADIYSDKELSSRYASIYKANTNHAIINLSSRFSVEKLMTTMTHEFQHLICSSDRYNAIRSVKNSEINTWLNEAMSATAEELLKKGALDLVSTRGYSYYNSKAFRNGQSLYNFSTTIDIGPYGAVYLFEEYMKKNYGEDYFSLVHKNIREYDAEKISDALVLYASAGEEQSLDKKYVYDEELTEKLDSEMQVWMSKLTLDFYLTTLSDSPVRTDIYAEKFYYNGKKMTEEEWMKTFLKLRLYTDVNATNIEGGGCVLVATEDGSFHKPLDAGEGLIYVALDENFLPIASSVLPVEEPEETTEESTQEEIFIWKGFTPNGNNTVYYLLQKGSKYNGTYVLANGIGKRAKSALNIEWLINHPVEDRQDLLDQLAQILSYEDEDLPGLLIVDYLSDDPLDLELCILLKCLTLRGVFVYTLGDIWMEPDTMTWPLHFDYSGKMTRKELNATYNSSTVKNWGTALGAYVEEVLEKNRPIVVYFTNN